MTHAPASLAGMGVVITRPQHQAESLCRLIESHGGRAIRFPTLEICAPSHPEAVGALMEKLATYNKAIFTSVNAVDWSMRLGFKPYLEKLDLQRIPIGSATAQALARHGLPPHIMPLPPFTSEALLTLPALQALRGSHIVIFRGEGGRTLLGTTLEHRGAQITYAEVYQRRQPAGSIDALLHYWKQGEIQAIVITSSESLRNLFAMVGVAGQRWLRRTPLVVLSARVQRLALQLGIDAPLLITKEASDTAIVESLRALASRGSPANLI